MRLQIVQALINNLLSRFPDLLLLDAGSVLSPSSWPDDKTERALFGNKESSSLGNLYVSWIQLKRLENIENIKITQKLLGKSCLVYFNALA